VICETLKIRELRRMRLAVHAVHMGEKFVLGFWSDNLNGRDQLVELVVDGRVLTYFVGNK
jgi:hypothetical protein